MISGWPLLASRVPLPGLAAGLCTPRCASEAGWLGLIGGKPRIRANVSGALPSAPPRREDLKPPRHGHPVTSRRSSGLTHDVCVAHSLPLRSLISGWPLPAFPHLPRNPISWQTCGARISNPLAAVIPLARTACLVRLTQLPQSRPRNRLKIRGPSVFQSLLGRLPLPGFYWTYDLHRNSKSLVQYPLVGFGRRAATNPQHSILVGGQNNRRDLVSGQQVRTVAQTYGSPGAPMSSRWQPTSGRPRRTEKCACPPASPGDGKWDVRTTGSSGSGKRSRASQRRVDPPPFVGRKILAVGT